MKKNSKKKGDYKSVPTTRKIKIRLTNEQFKTLKIWAGICRKIFNVALDSYNKKETEFNELDHKFTLSTSEFLKKPENEFILQCPKEVREIMIQRLKISLSTNFDKLKDGSCKKFKIKFVKKFLLFEQSEFQEF